MQALPDAFTTTKTSKPDIHQILIPVSPVKTLLLNQNTASVPYEFPNCFCTNPYFLAGEEGIHTDPVFLERVLQLKIDPNTLA